MERKKTYLGDSVYAAFDELGRIVLTTDNGYGPSNTIVLEPEVFGALGEFALAFAEGDHADRADRDQEEEETEADLGACCACGKTGPEVRNLIMWDRRAPVRGTGWGCLQCGLPSDGAVYVLCDRCWGEKREPKDVCYGYPKDNVRVAVATVNERFEHDMNRHRDEIP